MKHCKWEVAKAKSSVSLRLDCPIFNANVLPANSFCCVFPVTIFRVLCHTAKVLFENYANAAREQFEAADALATLVGQHGQFEEAKKYVEGTREKCSAACMALEKHWMEHSCREGIANGS